MEPVGAILRSERLRKGLTLDDINARTRIPVKNLQAIEDDDLSKMSSAFFYKSFVRQFAAQVGLDAGALSSAIEQAASAIPEPAVFAPVDQIAPKVAPIQPPRPKKLRGILSVFALAAVMTGCSAVYAMWQTTRVEAQTAPARPNPAPSATAPAKTPDLR